MSASCVSGGVHPQMFATAVSQPIMMSRPLRPASPQQVPFEQPQEAEIDFEAALAEACRILRTADLIDNLSAKTRVWFAGYQMADDDNVSNIVSTAQRLRERK